MSADSIPTPSSITHQHITAVINTLLGDERSQKGIRILDVGCGDGRLLSFMQDALPKLRPDMSFEFFGLDVYDAHVQLPGFMDETRQLLSSSNGSVNWADRIAFISKDEIWPFEAESFDFITSNMVLEHVADHDFVFGEMRRCLRRGAYSINLFPTREVIWEGHAQMPIVHWIKDERNRANLALTWYRLGFSRRLARQNFSHQQACGWKSAEEFSKAVSHVMESGTNYLTTQQIIAAADASGLRITFQYTKNFFISKLLSYLGKRPYRYRDWGLLEGALFFFGKRLSSVSVLLQNPR